METLIFFAGQVGMVFGFVLGTLFPFLGVILLIFLAFTIRKGK